MSSTFRYKRAMTIVYYNPKYECFFSHILNKYQRDHFKKFSRISLESFKHKGHTMIIKRSECIIMDGQNIIDFNLTNAKSIREIKKKYSSLLI